jgi:hypothetical protein
MNETDKQILKKIAKSMHKALCKAFHYAKKNKGKDVISDVVDPDYVAEADPSSVPVRRTGVMMKAKYSKEDIAKEAAKTVMKKYKAHKKSNL